MLELKIESRPNKGNLSALRKDGKMPAVFYGKKAPSTPITVSYTDFLKVWKEAGESTVITLAFEDKKVDTLIHDVDIDPVSHSPRHADFYVFDKDLKLEIDVPLEFVGTAPGVKDHGGLLVKVLHELKIEALPSNLPHQIEVDISTLFELNSQILAKEIKLPTGVELKENPEEVVVLVAEPKEEESEPEPVDLSSIEVEKKGKEKDAEEGESADAEADSPEENKE